MKSVYGGKNLIETISREDILHILKKWESNVIDVQDVYNWAYLKYLKENVDYNDCEGYNSVCLEVISYLDTLDLNLVTREDIPALIQFISTPIGEFKNGFNLWKDYINSIDITHRKHKLRNNPFYELFCK